MTAPATTLTQKITVLERYRAREDLNDAAFWYDDQGTGRRIHMNWQDYVDMGEPEKITLIIRPGDQLNQVEVTP